MIKAHESFIRGKPFKIGKTSIFLPTLDEIYEKELDLYFEHLYSLIMDFDKMRGSIETKENTYYTDYDLFIVLLMSDESFLKTALEALEFFYKRSFYFLLKLRLAVSEEKPQTENCTTPPSKSTVN